MLKISKSPDRHSFQKGGYVRRQEEKSEPINEAYLDMFDKIINEHEHKFDDPQSRINNMEYDLLTNDWILEKVRADDAYAQNLYSAMCNNGFIRLEVIPVLKGEEWGCSWRSAGGIIADMQEKGDYIDWYCSGIRDIGVFAPNEQDAVPKELTEEQLVRLEITKRYVPEGCITDEIRADLQRLGWAVASGGDWENFTKGD